MYTHSVYEILNKLAKKVGIKLVVKAIISNDIRRRHTHTKPHNL